MRKPRPEKKCLFCNKGFLPKRNDAIYCSTEHKEEHRKQKNREQTLRNKLARRANKFIETAFADYLIRECKRSETVEVLQNHDADSFLELFRLSKKKTLYSGFEDGKPSGFYELSHIQPVKQEQRLGLLHPQNLVLATKTYNRSRSTKAPEAQERGLAALRQDLHPKWKVGTSDTRKTILAKIQAYLGSSVLDPFLLEAKLTRTKKNDLIRKLAKIGVKPSFSLNLEQLQDLYQVHTGKDVSSSYNSQPGYLSWVLQKELERFSIDAGLYALLLDHLLRSSIDRDPLGITKEQEDFIYQQVQNLLHGDAVQDFDLDLIDPEDLSKPRHYVSDLHKLVIEQRLSTMSELDLVKREQKKLEAKELEQQRKHELWKKWQQELELDLEPY